MGTIYTEKKVISSTEYAAICIGEVAHEIPRHLLTGEQEKGYIYKDGSLTPVYYSNIRDIDNKRYILYPYLPLASIGELTTTLRPQAKSFLLQLSAALQKVPSDFLQSSTGIIPTWRIYFITTGGVLLLPDKLSSLILYSASEEDREEHLHRYMKPNLSAPFALYHQLFQLLYLSAAKMAPYEMKETRVVKWTHIPLSLGFTSLDQESANLIDSVLQTSQIEMREKFSSAYSSSENLSLFDKNLESIQWNVKEDDPNLLASSEHNVQLSEYIEKLKIQSKRRTFWRKRGFALSVAAVATIIVLFSVVQIIVKANQPPYTASMDQPQIIEEFFSSQNELDIQQMNASLTKKVTNPFEKEVSSLYVNSKMRQAYEGIDSIISPQEFEEIEGGEIVPSTMIYGVDNLSITQVSENTFEASFDYWTPEIREQADSPEEVITIVRILHKTMRFTFIDTKGYYQISGIESINESLIKELVVPQISSEVVAN